MSDFCPYCGVPAGLHVCAKHPSFLRAAEEHREMLAATRSAFVPDWRLAQMESAPDRRSSQTTPGRVVWTIRGTA